jgi:hypothetical protein
MGKGRDKRRRNAQKPWERTRQEEEVVEAFEAAEFWRQMRKRSSSRAPSDPPVFGEPDAPVRAPLKPSPNLRSGAIALREPESEIEFLVLKSRSI